MVGILPEHISTVLEVAEEIPDLKMVFDHLNQPPISSKEKFGEWGKLMKEAATKKNLHAKISGMGTTSRKDNWTKEDLLPYIEFALEQFGVERCFCGGDWPVSLLAGSYLKTWQVYRDAIESLLTDEEQEQVFYGNAVEFYRL